jgi:YD repeat-containing protein
MHCHGRVPCVPHVSFFVLRALSDGNLPSSGEALSSLCELAGSFVVTTKTKDDAVGIALNYDAAGRIVSKVRTGECCPSVHVHASLVCDC